MKRGITSWPRAALALALVAGLGSVSALGQSPTPPDSSREAQFRRAVPVELPEPRRITVAARPVVRGEIAIFDPIVLGVVPTRGSPGDVVIPDPFRLAISGAIEGIGMAVPDPLGPSISALRTAPRAAEVTRPVAVTAVITRTAPSAAPTAEGLTLPAVSARRGLSEIEVPELTRLQVNIGRGKPFILSIEYPIEASIGVNRVPLSVAEAEAVIAACDFVGIRAHLRALVAASSQLDSDGRKVVAELSRLNRANTAFVAARLRYDDGKLDEANMLLVVAEKTHCVEREQKIEAGLGKIMRLRQVVATIDQAIKACNIPAMESLSGQLEGQTHILLSGRRDTLDSMAGPAAIATAKSVSAGIALAAGRLEEAKRDLAISEHELAGMPDALQCLTLREQVAAQGIEADRVIALAGRADAAVAACNIPSMTALSSELAPETNVLLTAKVSALDAVNGPATAARDLVANAAAPFDKGKLDASQSMLLAAAEKLGGIDDPDLCPQIRENIAGQLAEIKRVRAFAAEVGKDIVACTAAEIASLGKRLIREENVLLVGRRAIVQQIEQSVDAAHGSFEQSTELYIEGQLDGAEEQAKATLDELSAIRGITACEPIRENVATRLADIENLRAMLADAETAVAACEVSAMRSLAAGMEGAEHTLLVAERKRLLDIGEPVADASGLNQAAAGHYAAGRLDEAETALRDAAGRLAEVESCAPLKTQIAGRLDRIDRLRVVLARVDKAVAACRVPAMTSMAAQLEGQSHVLLADRLAKVVAVNTPAAAALNLRRDGRKAFKAGDLSAGQRLYSEAQGQLATIPPELCTDMREDATRRLARIAEISTTLAKVEDTVAACSLPGMRAMGEALEGQSYVLLAASRQRVLDIIAPLAKAHQAHKRARGLYKNGDLADAAKDQKRAADALGRIDGQYCVDFRQEVATSAALIVRVQTLIAQADSNMATCRTDGTDKLAQELASIDHRLLRSKKAEVDAFYRPINATTNLIEAAAGQYFKGNIDAAENRLVQARRELADRDDCSALYERIDRNVARIAAMGRALNLVDRAAAACSISAMTSMSRQLDGQSHILLVEKKEALDSVMVPASKAQRRSQEAWPLFENGQLVAAQTRLEQALDQLDRIRQIDRALCTPLLREIEVRLKETDRIRSTLVIVDSALSSCNFADIDLLKSNLANATHVSLKRAYQDLQAGRLRCGLSDDEKLTQAEATCRRKYDNSIVDEFDVRTGTYNCVCATDYMWDPENAACIARADVQDLSNQVCASGYPNSIAVNIRGPKQFECNCREGFVWNEDETSCVAADVVVQNAVEACARENGYPAEIEGAGRFTCCPNGTSWDGGRRECINADEALMVPSGGDPQCRWVNNPGSISDDYLCTCDPEELCSARPEPTPAFTEAPNALPETTDAAPVADDDVVDKIRKLFGDMF